MSLIQLDSGKPLHEQKDQLVAACKSYSCIMTDYSALAEKAFCLKMSTKVEPVGPKSIGFDPAGTAVPKLSGQTIPVVTPWIDPRKAPFNGDPELTSAYIGQLLAVHIQQTLQQLKLQGHALGMRNRSTVLVIGKIPFGMRKPDERGMSLSGDIPLLRGRIDLIVEKEDVANDAPQA